MSYNNTSIDRNYLLLTRVRLIVKFYIWPLLVLFGLTGNCLSILVLTRRRLIRTSTNNYLTILAAFDSCYLISTLILNFGSHSTFSQNSIIQTLLYFLRPLADFSSNTATWLIVCFTLERTLAVARPIYAKRTCSVRRSRRLIGTLLIICFLITLPTYFEKHIRDMNNRDNNQNLTSNITQKIISKRQKQKEFYVQLYRLYLVFICVVIIWIPLVLLCICNSILIWYVHRSRRFDDAAVKATPPYNSYSSLSSSAAEKFDYMTNTYPKSQSSCSSTIPQKNPISFHLRRHTRSYIQKRKVTIVLIFCLCVALLLWTPQSLSLTYETLIESYSQMSPERRTILLIFNNFANLFLCINASIDFILYCFLSDKFARTCKQIVWRQCSNHKTNSSLRSRRASFDHTSFILPTTSNNIHQQQQQLAANKTNNYYSQLYHSLQQSSINQKNQRWKPKFAQTTTSSINTKCDTRVFYQTSLVGNKQKFLTINKKQNSRGLHKSLEIFPSPADDYTTNELNASSNTSLSSNRQVRSNTTPPSTSFS